MYPLQACMFYIFTPCMPWIAAGQYRERILILKRKISYRTRTPNPYRQKDASSGRDVAQVATSGSNLFYEDDT